MSESKVSIVFCEAHAADMVNSSGGTIASCTRAGHRVTWVCLTPGEIEKLSLGAEEYRRLKIEGWEKSADIL